MLVRDAWQCRGCGRVCSGHREAHADHIVPINEGGARYDVANGQTLCVRCHGAKTRQEQTVFSAAREPQPSRASGPDRPPADADANQGGPNHPNFGI